MQNRIFHRPTLHTSGSGIEKRASWLELFYDLVFVASFIQLGNSLSDDLSIASVTMFSVVFAALWFSWTGFTFYSNRFNVDDSLHRFLVFLQMLAIAAMAAFAPSVLSSDATYFSLASSLSQYVVAALYLRSYEQESTGRGFSRYWGLVFFFGGTAWLISSFLPAPWHFVFWAIGLLSFVGAPFSHQSQRLAQSAPYDLEHLSERYGILTIIVLGEAFVKILSGLTHGAPSATLLAQSAYTLLIGFSIWWIYFDDIASAQLKERTYAFNLWLYGHIPLHASIVVLGVAIYKAAQFDLSVPAPSSYRYLLTGSLGLAFLSVALLDAMTERRQAELNDRVRINARLVSALLLFLLAPAGRGMEAGFFLAVVGIVCGAQVVFDIMMAPLTVTKHEGHVSTTAEIAKRRLQGEEIKRPRVGETVRRGVPNEMRRDLYFYFIEGSWRRFFASVIVAYFLINVLFAGLYMIEPGSIASARPDSFADAFYFSVQTLATIGYGHLYPQSNYGNVIVVIEAAIGLAGVALVTGLMFAKASKPRAHIVFSRVAVVNQMNGKPMLMFRAGNMRGNDIVSAEVQVSILRDEISPEGQHLRRLHDLKLVRHRSPFFTLTWQILHEIDASSPFYSIVEGKGIDPSIISVVCILTGHDSTYGQTIYSRHLYYMDQVRVGARFVDVIGQLEDGRTVVDYTKFHDVLHEGAEGAETPA